MSRTARTEFDPHAGPPARRRRRWFLPLLIALAASPLLLDGAMLCYARWSALFGPMPIVRTPVLDAAGSYAGRAADSLRSLLTSPLRRRWGREYAVGVLLLSLAAGALMMRSNRPR